MKDEAKLINCIKRSGQDIIARPMLVEMAQQCGLTGTNLDAVVQCLVTAHRLVPLPGGRYARRGVDDLLLATQLVP